MHFMTYLIAHEANHRGQIILGGQSIGSSTATEYHSRSLELEIATAGVDKTGKGRKVRCLA
jgi:hypothetical protein